MADHANDGNGQRAGLDFAHLHLHSEYSLLDGGNTIKRLVKRVKDLGMSSVAVTDHGNLHAAAEFYGKARAEGIKPILGIEAYVAIGDRRERKQTGIADGGFHLVLLAENETGWRNLLRLSSDAYLNGFYYKPRMDKSTLAEWSEGLIAINGHLGSSIAHHLVQLVETGSERHWGEAVEEARWHLETFTPNANGDPCFYVELQRHSVQLQERINPHLARLAEEVGAPLVCDNDAHFLGADDWDAHDTLCCISMGKTKDDPSRLHYPRELYVKSPEEMAENFRDHPEAVENTLRIAERCNVDLDFEANHAPVVRIRSDWPELPEGTERCLELIRAFECEHEAGSTDWYKAFCERFELEPFDTEKVAAEGRTADELQVELKEQCDRALRMLCEAGAIWRYGEDGVTPEIRARLDRELGILADKLISAYFLICWDFVNWGRQRGIPANARGSGVGTMVGYVLGLSNACPVEYGLLFERFTDPDRTEYPDIDIDLCQDGRGDVIDYVREKYGYVAQIITFGRLKARAAIKDVARVMGELPAEGQRLANLVPGELNITIDDALAKEPDLAAAYQGEERVRRIVDTAKALEDHARHAGIHAAGVVVATQPLENIVPLCKLSSGDGVVTQWDGPTCEKVGLLKMDFLGLRTLSTIERARELVQETLDDEAIWAAVRRDPSDGGPHPLDLDRLEYEDQRVFELFRRGDTMGIFQFESGGMRKLLLDMKPDRLADLIAANALFRPGPMDLIPAYCARKHGTEKVPQVHPIVDGFTAETYGIMVYQEQVMQIVHELGGIPLRAAYTLIKAISKKKKDVIDSVRPRFVEGAGEKGLEKKKAEELFELILKFAGYGFNKSHSTGYAIIAYQTAYLKTCFPAQYMAAVLSFESQAKKVEEWTPYLQCCRDLRRPGRAAAAEGADDVAMPAGVRVAPPDLNLSDAGFTVVHEEDEPRDADHGHIRFGLGAVKGVGRSAIDAIIAERREEGDFKSLFDFCERMGNRTVNKATVEALVRCGAFDGVHGAERRASVHAAIEDAMNAGAAAARDREAGQMSIFGELEAEGTIEPVPEPQLPTVTPWTRMEMLAGEKETMGIYVSGHPLEEHRALLEPLCSHDIAGLESLPHDRCVVVAAMIDEVRIVVVKQGRSAGAQMAILTVQDVAGSLPAVVFADAFAKYASCLNKGDVVVLLGRIDRGRGETQVLVDAAWPAADAPRHLAGRIEIDLTGVGSAFLEDDAGAADAGSMSFAKSGSNGTDGTSATNGTHATNGSSSGHADGTASNGAAGDRSAEERAAISAMRMTAGILQQAAATATPGAGRPAEIRLRMRTEGKHVELKPGALRVVPGPELFRRLEEVIGPGRLRLVGEDPAGLSRSLRGDDRRRGGRRRG